LALEDFLGVAMFHRGTRQITLTNEGADYFAAVTEVLERLDEATRAATSPPHLRPLHVWSPMAFSMRWLLPRMPSFHAASPQRDITLTAYMRASEFAQGQVELAIRLGRGNWPGMISHPLVSVELLPVCSPALLERQPLRQPADLARHTLLHSS